MDSTTTESSLLSKLQSPDLSNTHRLFSSYLHPFSPLLQNPKTPPKPPNSKTLTLTRSLAKQFLPFLNKSLSLLPKILSQTPKLCPQFCPELFDTYKLCLDCLDAVSLQLSCKPYSVQIQRVRLIHCFEFWGEYGDAESEGLLVLQSFRCVEKKGSSGNKFVPDFREESLDQEFALLVVEIVVTLVKCAAMSQVKEEDCYRRVLVMVSEIEPWFRVLDANVYEKMHRVLVTYMSKCGLYLVGELNHFDKKLVHQFCLATFAEFAKSSKDQMHKFARRICYSLFSQQDNHSSIIDILTCVLESVAGECKVGTQTTLMEFLELVHYCANKCRTAAPNICGTVAEHFQRLANDFCLVSLSPADLIMSLYLTGLKLHGFTTSKMAKDLSISGFLFDNEHRLQNLMTFLGLLKRHYDSNRPKGKSNYKPSICTQNGKPDMLSYCSALQFLCRPLADFIVSEKKEIIAEIEDDDSFARKLYIIEDAFHQFLDVFLLCQSASERERDAYDDNTKTFLSVAVAGFTLSFRTKRMIKESVTFIKHAISSDWIQSHGLKFLFASLHNIGVVLYRNKKMKEASKALKLCCRASWTCVLNHCNMFVEKSDGIYGDPSEDAIVGFVTESCTKTAFLLDILYQCGSSHKVNKVIIDSLESWSVAESLFERLASPTALVKQWVKIECKLFTDGDVEHNAKTLYSLLSAKVSKRAMGKLFEQEILSYKEMNSLNPKLCQRLQMDIMDILLEEVYVTKTIDRSRVFISKARELRAYGIERLNDCIECLSEAISIMRDMNGDMYCSSIIWSHQIANAYCLRALCTQEALCTQGAEPNSKVLLHKRSFEDIDAAMKLWLNVDRHSASEQTNIVSENTLILFYYVVDLLSLKGYMKFHADIYEIMIRFFEWKNIPINKCLSMLWKCRRLGGHTLCASSVNDMFLMTLSRHCDEPNSMEFWLSSLKESEPLQLGFNQNFSFMFTNFSTSCHHHCESSSRSDITIDEAKRVASDLLSSAPLPSGSAFLAAYLYYDLSEGLILNGQLVEALSYAKEAHRLRSKLFQEKFMYAVEQQDEVYNENGEVVRKHFYSLKTFRIFSSAATAAWVCETVPFDFDHPVLTPWNVLQCYLESILQVGAIHEIVGNGSDAETLLLWGKNISCSQDLPLFIIAFSSSLGKLYCKQRLWDLAEKELRNAEQTLKKMDSWSPFYCCKCRLVLESSVDQQLGDLSRGRHVDRNIEYPSIDRLLYDAINRYESAVKKLKTAEWRNYVSNPKEATVSGTMSSDALIKDTEHGVRKTRKASKTLPQSQCLTHQQNRMTTRSRTRSYKKNSDCNKDEVQIDITLSSKRTAFACSDAHSQHAAIEGKSVNKLKCLHCLPHEVGESGNLNNYIHMKWEFVRRRLLLRVLTCIGKCLVIQSEIQNAHKIFSESIYVLVRRDLFSSSQTYDLPFKFMLDLIGSHIPGDVLAVERAMILYNLSWFILKSYHCKGTSVGSDLSSVEISRIVSWLKLAFILCREVPILFQKVSRLLAVLYIHSSIKLFSLPPSHCEAFSTSHWASYFHQASLGTHFNHHLFSRKQNGQKFMEVEGGCLSSSTSSGSEKRNSVSGPTPDSLLEEVVSKFFQSLPPTTVICVSLLGDSYTDLLGELFFSPSSVHAWILLSRLNSNSQPIVLLLPVDSISEEASDDDGETSSPGNLLESSSVDRWRCPWGSTVVDDVAPMFKQILEQNYLSSSTYPLIDTKTTRSLWWMQRRKLDQYLGKFLRNLEDTWFGPWRFLLLGEWSNCRHLNLVQNKLADDLKVKCKVDIHDSLLRVILSGGKYACQNEECILELILNKGCFVGGMECNINEMSGAFKQILETIKDIEEGICVNREPIILVLDNEVQMLPWESLPLLRNQEVYRMPSIGSILASLDRYDDYQEKLIGTEGGSIVFPSIDPLDAYYLLNPSGDLSSTEVEFDDWFKDQNLEGKTGSTPTIEELTVALKNHELFIYFGHGSGAQYIPGHEIQKLDTCAATLLMGCSSGSLSLSGPYTPQGAPLCYLLAGSPVIVANLWEVTDKDIDRFGKAMLDAWLRERSNESTDCGQCNSLSEKFKSLNINVAKGNGKRKISRKKVPEDCDVNTCNHCCKRRPKIGSFMGQAREACTLPFLIGAAPVCYGVPTGIKKKLDL